MTAAAPGGGRQERAAFWFTLACCLGYAGVIGLQLLDDLANRPIWFDEACSHYQVAGRGWADLIDAFGAGVNAMPYAYFVLLWGVDQAFGLSPLLLRLPSALIGLLGICLLHGLLARWRGPLVALIACVTTLLLSVRFMGYTHEARPYALYFLAAVLGLYAGAAVLRDGGRTLRPLAGNTLAALALPAVHYVGLLYGAALAAALLWALPPGAAARWRVAASFLLGWGVFAAIQAPQVMLFVGAEPLLEPVLIRREPFQVFATAEEAFTLLPTPVPVILLAFMLLAWRRGDPPRCGASGSGAVDPTPFLLATAALWTLMPIALYLHGMFSSPHLAMPRYFTPSLLAPALASAFALSVFYPRDPAGIPLRPGRDTWRFDLAGLTVALGFLGYTSLAAVKHIRNAPDLVSRRVTTTDLVDIARSPIPVVTNDPLLFVEYNYHAQGLQRLLLLRETPREVAGFRRFAPALPVVMPRDLAALPHFLYVSQGEFNACPGFDLTDWARAHGAALTQRSGMGDARVTEVQAAAP